MRLFPQLVTKYFATSFIGQPQARVWSHFELINLPNQNGGLLISVKGLQAKNFAYECLSGFKNVLPLSAEAVYQKLQELIDLAGNSAHQLELALVLTTGRKIVYASFNAGIYLKRAVRLGNLFSPQPKLQFVLGRKHLDEICWLYSSASQKKIAHVHKLNLPNADKSSQNNLFSQDFNADQILAVISFNQQIVDEINLMLSQPRLVTQDNPQISLEIENLEEPKKIVSRKFEVVSKTALALKSFFLRLQKLPKPAQLFHKLQLPKLVLPKLNLSIFSWWFGSNRVYLDQHLAKRSLKKFSWILSIIAAVVIVLIIYLYQQYQARSRVNIALQPYFDQLASIISTGDGQPVLAKKQTENLAKDLLVQKTNLSKTEYGKNRYGVIEANITNYLQSLTKHEIQDIPIFDDLRNQSVNFVTSHVGYWDQVAVFADAQQQLLIYYNLKEKKAELLDLGHPVTFRAISLNTNTETILLANGIVKLEKSGDQIKENIAVNESDFNRLGTLMATFQTNLYVFNPDQHNIFRYIEQGLGYSKPAGWFSQPVNLDFKTVTSMAVDGDVWLGTNKGEVLKFSGGKPAEFNLTDLPRNFTSSLQLATAPDHPYLYILEQNQNRVVVLDKQGKFMTQIISPLLGTATHLVFSQSLNLLLAVSGSVLYQIPL